MKTLLEFKYCRRAEKCSDEEILSFEDLFHYIQSNEREAVIMFIICSDNFQKCVSIEDLFKIIFIYAEYYICDVNFIMILVDLIEQNLSEFSNFISSYLPDNSEVEQNFVEYYHFLTEQRDNYSDTEEEKYEDNYYQKIINHLAGMFEAYQIEIEFKIFEDIKLKK